MTLKEIAARAGVSAATVSYVLNNSAKVSDETKHKVEKIIQETGYRSNMLAQSLRKNHTSLVGVVVEDITVWQTALTRWQRRKDTRLYSAILDCLQK